MRTHSPLYNFTLTLHLAYNVYDLRDETIHESEECYELDSPIEWDEDGVFEEHPFRAKFAISGVTLEDGTGDELPEHYFLLTVSNVTAHRQEEAWEFVIARMDGICRALTFILNKADLANKAAFQPRVYPDYGTMKETHETLPAEDENNVDDGVARFALNEGLYMHESFHLTAVCRIRNGSGDFRKYYSQKSYRAVYITDQLYMALGSEQMSSKFFHLAAIIEFVEREYNDMDASRRLFSEAAEREQVRQAVTAAIDELHLPANTAVRYLNSACGRNLAELTDIGRDEKLKNILHSMGIASFVGPLNETIAVTKKYCGTITGLRNKYFHAGDTAGGSRTKLSTAVAELICLCMAIAEWAGEADP